MILTLPGHYDTDTAWWQLSVDGSENVDESDFDENDEEEKGTRPLWGVLE